MKVWTEKEKVIVHCKYEEKEIVKGIGDFKFHKPTKTWQFPLRKLVNIIDNLHIEYTPGTYSIYERLREDLSKYHSKVNSATAIKTRGVTPAHEVNYPECYEHQKQAIALGKLFDSYAFFMETGCVSGDTEYLTPTGWKRIDEYSSDDLVAQYDLKRKIAKFVYPKEYIKKPATIMFHLKTSTGIDQMLSPEHRVLSFQSTTNNPKILSAQKCYEKHQQNLSGSKVRILSAFHLYNKYGMRIFDNDLRLQIAVMADGHFPNKNNSCRVRLRKTHKIERLHLLLKNAGIEYRVHIDVDGMPSFSFQAPIRTKYFIEEFWQSSYHQREIICDEIKYWDASIRKGNKGVQYFCHCQSDADFVQYCFASTGKKASIHIKDRGYKRLCYTVNVVGSGIKGNYVHIGKMKHNISIKAAPDGYKYCFEVPSTFLILRRNGHIFITGNTGKSLVAIKLIEYWNVPAMIVAPLSTLEKVWEQEFSKWSKLKLKPVILWGNLKEFSNDDYNVYLVNYEHFKKLHNNKKYNIPDRVQAIVIDESSKLKNPKSDITKTVLLYKDKIKHKICLSGTPAPNNLMEYFGQMCFINSELLGENFYRFRNTFFYSTGYEGFLYKPNKGAREAIIQNVGRQAFSVRKQDCLDLPERVHEERVAYMDPIQEKAYDEMLKENVIEFQGHTTIGANELAKLMKLRQVTSGFTITIDKLPVLISESKVKLLKEIISEIPEDKSLIIFCQFHWEIEMLKRILGDEATTLYGAMTQKEKNQAIQDFLDKKYRFLISHPKSGGIGLNFQSVCNYMIWFSLSYSQEEFSQACDRIYRSGQVNKCTYFILLAKRLKATKKKDRTVDEVIYEVLQTKADLMHSCMEMLKG